MTSVVETETPLRADVITQRAISDKILANAPDGEGSFFAVPKVVE